MKKIIDEQGRVFGKISVIDLFVILIVLIIAAGLYVKYDVLNVTSKTAESTPITYTVQISGVRQFAVDALKVGDSFYDSKNGGTASIGTISDISVTDAKMISQKTDGTCVLGNYRGRYDVTLTITAHGTTDAGRYLVNRSYEINANSKRTFETKFCTFEATISGVQ